MPNLVNGLGGLRNFGEGFLQSNDDRSTNAIDVTSIFGAGGLYLNGIHYTQLFVNNNGNITFGGPLADGNPSAFGQAASPIVIAPYWMDLDGQGPHGASAGGTSTGSGFVFYDLDAAHKTFTATWDDLGYDPSAPSNPAAFQVQLVDAGNGDFDIVFIYEWIGPVGANQPNIAHAGFSLGTTAGTKVSFDLPASGNGEQTALLDTANGNTGQAGYWVFHIRGGKLEGATPPPTDPPPTDPPPTDPPPTDPPPTDPPPTDPPPTDPPPTDPPPTDPPPGDPPPVVVPPATAPPEPPGSVPVNGVSFAVSFAGAVHEGDSGVTPYGAQITRSGDLDGPSTVSWEIVIPDPTDLAPGQALSGTASFGPGQRVVTVPIGVQGDKLFEGDDQFAFKLTSATHGTVTFTPTAQANGVIINDDAPVNFAFTGPQLHAEGFSGTTPFEFVVLRTGDLTQASTVTWEISAGQADSLDFAPGQALSGVVSFAAGATQATITIEVAGDTRPEFDETFGIRLTAATTGGAVTHPGVSTTGTILDDDLRHNLLVATPTALVRPEGDSGLTEFRFDLLRTGDTDKAVTTTYAIVLPTGGLGAAEVQTPLTGTVTFAAGSASAVLSVLVTGDTTPEDNEAFSVSLGGGEFNLLMLSGVVMNDDQSNGSSVPSGAPLSIGGMDGEPTSFMQLLVGGGLWSGGGAGGV